MVAAVVPHAAASDEVLHIAAEVQKTPAQVALNWCTAHENVIAIPKSNRQERIAENCGASGWRLSTAQIQRLDAAFH
jgi:diketogulonate reductase-like aldo/keto reductase